MQENQTEQKQPEKTPGNPGWPSREEQEEYWNRKERESLEHRVKALEDQIDMIISSLDRILVIMTNKTNETK